LFTVVTPAAHGSPAGMAAIAADIWLKLQQPAPLGARGQGKVIVDLTGLSKKQQRDVFEYLKHLQPKRLLDHVLIHDREAGRVVPFDPENL
jgi:hypothetical protein